MRIPKPVLLLSSGHFCVDMYSSMLAAFLPFLQDKLDLSLSQAGMLVGVLVFSSSLTQPVYGLLSDRFRSRAFVVLGPALAGLFISSLGLAPSFNSLLFLLFIAGVGIASYHPQGAALTHRHSERNPAFHMSIYVTAGTVGFALGPLYITSVIQHFGLPNSFWATIPDLLVSLFLYFHVPGPTSGPAHLEGRPSARLRTVLRPLLVLYTLVVLRSITHSGIASFLPLYYIQHGYSAYTANRFLTIFLFAGGASGLAGGWLASRFSGKKLLAFSFITSVPLFLAFLTSQGIWSVLFGSAGAAFLLLTNPLNVVMAQNLVPHGASTIAALTMGFAWGMAGLLIPIIGSAIEIFGFESTFAVLTLLALPAFILTFLLPDEKAGDKH